MGCQDGGVVSAMLDNNKSHFSGGSQTSPVAPQPAAADVTPADLYLIIYLKLNSSC